MNKKVLSFLFCGLAVFMLCSCGVVGTMVEVAALTSPGPYEYTDAETLKAICEDPEGHAGEPVCIHGYVGNDPTYVKSSDCTVFSFMCQPGDNYEKAVVIVYSGEEAEEVSEGLKKGSSFYGMEGTVYGLSDAETPQPVFDIKEIFPEYRGQ